jgi:hypothetical protein
MHSYKYSTQYFLVFSLLIPQMRIGTFFRPYPRSIRSNYSS